MKETPLQLQIYFELALSVGNGTELKSMLKQSISSYLRKLSCSAGMILRCPSAEDDTTGYQPVLSIPKRIDRNPAIVYALELLPKRGQDKKWKTFLSRLPLLVTAPNAMQIHVMELPSYGLLLLAKNGDPLPEHVTKSLQPINRKLAEACHACIQKMKVEQLVVQLQHEAEEREKAQQKLARSKEKYQRIFENIQDVYYESTIEGKVLEVSPSVEKVLGYRRREMGELSITDIYCRKKDREAAITELETKGSLSDHEIRVRNKSGDQLLVSVNATMVRDSKGQPLKIIGSIRDISKRKRAEMFLQFAKDQALKTASELELANKELLKLHRAIEQSPVSVVITDNNGIIEYVNPAFCKISGYPIEKAIGQIPRFLKSNFLDKALHRDLWNSLKSGRPWEGEFLNKGKDGRTFWEQAFITPVKSGSGEITHYISLTEDITWRKTAEEKLAKAKQQIDHADAARSEFLANMSHEIRTPLNGVIGMTALLLESELTPDQKDMADTIRTSADSLMTATNNILDYSKIMADQLTLDEMRFDLQQLFDEVSAILSSQLENKKVDLFFDIAPDIPLEVHGDNLRIKQILINLAENAIKFTEHGQVAVQATLLNENSDTATYRFNVQDSGIGISKEYLPHLFDSFSQHDSSLSRKYGGAGLGLAICKALVEAMNGRIGVESEVGTGSNFWFEIRLAKQPGSRRSETDEAETVTQQLQDKVRADTTILVVEDNLINRKIAVKILDTLGYGVEAVTNGREAVDAVQKKEYQLILMDIQMPEMDGLQATRAIRTLNQTNRSKTIPIIALTAHALKADRKICLEAGMDDYLPKPVDPKQLEAAIEKQLSG